MGKNLMADTDFTDGRDQRFVHSVCIGRVSKIECTDKAANIRVIMPDKLDHQGSPLITKPIPVLQISAGGKRSFAMPRIGQNVLLVKLPNSTSSYAAIGHFYTSTDPYRPPVTDPKLDYVIYDEGSTKQFDANDGKGDELWNLKGKITFNADGTITVESKNSDIVVKSDQGKVTVEANSDVTVKSDSGQVTVQGATSVTLQAPTIYLKGNIVHTGDMNTTGIHTDSLGHHS
jgi:phage baseplate assembly protein gpV